MKNQKILIGAGIVIIVLVLLLAFKNGEVTAPTETKEAGAPKAGLQTSKGTTNTKTSPSTGQTTTKTASVTGVKVSNLPEIDFIDKRLAFELKDYPGVKMTIEKVVFGRGEKVTSTGCSGIPNANFSTYLYPGSGICISESEVDGSERGVIAFHVLVENNSNFGFGGNSNVLRLHYLRSDSSGKPVDRFAHPLNDLSAYYINGYSSRDIILSYLVPEDQMVYQLVSGYKDPLYENKTLNVFDFSTNGFLIDWTTKSIKLVK
jgi:hypothetical protein